VKDNFDWRTEEDSDWDAAGMLPQATSRRRRRIWVVAILLAAIVVGSGIYWQVRDRLTAAEAAISDDVVSSFHLIRQANSDGDLELFRNLLSGSDLEWASAQQELFAQGLLFDLSPFGLAQRPGAVTDVIATLDPSLNSADVTALSTYAQADQQLNSGAISLLRTDVFRRGERWVWSPPRDEFWQGEATTDLEFLSLSYPKRDEALSLRLSKDLDSLVSQVCTIFNGVDCPDNVTVNVTFSHEPSTLVEIGKRFATGGLFASQLNRQSGSYQKLEMTLPTPSLLGLPVDDLGYQALLRGYGSHLLVAIADRFVAPDCCGGPSRLRAATRKILEELDLNVHAPIESSAEFELNDIPDEGQIALLCSDGFVRRQRLFLLDPGRMDWREQMMQTDLLAVKAMPDSEGALLLGQSAEDDGMHSQVWNHTRSGNTLIFDLAVSQSEAEQVGWELLEQQGLLVIEVPDLSAGTSRYFTIDLAQCSQGDCQTGSEVTLSRPVWSPGGGQLIIRAYGLLWWRAGESTVPIEDGSSPFWVDEDTYGYARSLGRDQAIFLVNVGDTESERLVLTTNELRDAMDSDSDPGRLLIGRVLVRPKSTMSGENDSAWLILAFEVGRDGGVSGARFFSFDPEREEVSLVPHSGLLLSFNMTPSGELMAFGGFADDDGRWMITAVGQNLEEVTTIALETGGSADSVPSYSWSEDESWLMILEQGLLTLYHLDTGTVHKIRLPDASCVQAAWYG